MKYSYDEIYNGPRRSGPIATMPASGDDTGRFLAVPGGTHEHNWIFGDVNAVCTKCGYALPKETELPTRGLYSPERGKKSN